MKTLRMVCVVALLVLFAMSFACTSKENEQKAEQPQTAEKAAQSTPKMKCQERFASLDKDGNGEVTFEEFSAISHPGGNAEVIFKARDKDVNGSLTVEEFCAARGMGKGKNAPQ